MNPETEALSKEIEEFLSRTGMGPTYFGQLAVGNARLVPRLREGGTVTLPTAEKLRAFMAGYGQ